MLKNLIYNILNLHNIDWDEISINKNLSEEFIEKHKDKINWSYISYSQVLSEQFIEKFQNKMNWTCISRYQRLSERFIEKFQDKVDWFCISIFQNLSEKFIEEFQDKISWRYISGCQNLSESFIEKFKNKVDWFYISQHQKLSEEFIEKYQNELNWYWISRYQKLSKRFIKRFKNKIDIEIQLKTFHVNKTIEQKKEETKEYAERYNLKFENDILYCYRNHDKFGHGTYSQTTFYKNGKYYKDWRVDMNPNNKNSFGFGIFPEGNTLVKVKVEDWGVIVNRNDGKCRVWGFEIC